MKITLDGLTLDASKSPADADEKLYSAIASACRVSVSDVESYRIVKRSLDARKKPRVSIIYRVEAALAKTAKPSGNLIVGNADEIQYRIPENKSSLKHPVVIGAGPAGLFGALVLAEAGAEPIIIERGYDVEKRANDIQSFLENRTVNSESNYLYGEGGAGTWSDGKLFTRIRDERMAYVMKEFVDAGAQKEILYYSHPHIGSDVLPRVIANIRKKIISLGGRFVWGAQIESLIISNGSCRGVKLASGEKIDAPKVLAAFGHSARKLIMNLTCSGVPYVMKGFQIGMRAEHPQAFINDVRYGVETSYPALGAAEYNVSCKPTMDGKINGATSFCMCPGGILIPAVCDDGQLCTNGMSNAKRDGEFANAALITSLSADTFANPAAAFSFIEKLERKAFLAGGGDYTAPAQSMASFISDAKPRLVRSETSYGLGLVEAKLDTVIPENVSRSLKRAVGYFNKTMPGFIDCGMFIGIESKVSSPVRFIRNEDSLESMDCLYIAGEGAGMAGGITSAAVDGIRLAEAMLKK